VATWRSDEAKPPDVSLVAPLTKAYRQAQVAAARAGQGVVGLQLDVDCPTRSLATYADFLTSLRRQLPSGTRLSVTALLDWFGKGTEVHRVLAAVDDYVPQFYDVALDGPGSEIAHPIEVRRWAAIFNGYGTRYRIGISAFGRVQRVRSRANGAPARDAFRDARVLDLWSARFRLVQTTTNGAAERVLSWDVLQGRPPALEAGDRVEAILPTPESVRSAYEAAHAFGGLCAGVIFFRWPGPGETLLMTPDEIAESLRRDSNVAPPRLETSDGGCTGRSCADLRVRLHDRFPTRPTEFRITASTDVEYLLAAGEGVTLRQLGPRQIAVAIPAYVGQSDVPLGRAFARQPGRYAIAGDGE
jgi:hypothetical protein